MLTSAQIVTLACQIAKCPGYVTQAGQLLNVALNELCQNYDFTLAKGVINFNFAAGVSGPNLLPTDWLRAQRNDVFYTISGVPYFLINLDNSQFDAEIQQAGFTSYPSSYTVIYDSTGVTAPALYAWPPPAGAYPVTARYQRQMPDIDTPETSTTIPWFPNQNYLIAQLAGQLMQITDDERAPMFLGGGDQGARGILERYLKLEGDDEDRAKVVTLDRRLFRPGAGNLPNTKQIGW